VPFLRNPVPFLRNPVIPAGIRGALKSTLLRQSSPAPEIPAEDEEPEEDELAMSGVEDAAEDIVGDEVKGADEV